MNTYSGANESQGDGNAFQQREGKVARAIESQTSKLPSDVFREHSLACYVTDKTSLKLRHEIGIDIIAWECDYPHSDCFWPDAPEQVLAELTAAGADAADINKITWQNACNFFTWDPFARTPRSEATVGALRAKATDVDVSIRPRADWRRLYEQKQLAKA